MRQSRVVVAVHDVEPRSIDEVRFLLHRLEVIGIHRRVLKVIPASLQAADGTECRDLVNLLRDEVQRGGETLVHGLTHQTAGPLRGSLSAVIRARLFAPAAAEFLSIDEGEGERRLRAGRDLLNAADLPAHGFCAPAWLQPRWLDEACRRTGYAYVVSMARLHDLRSDRVRRMPWIGYLGASAQEPLVHLGSAVLGVLGRHRPVLKVFLHPQGARQSAACERVLRALARIVSRREVVTYRELLD